MWNSFFCVGDLLVQYKVVDAVEIPRLFEFSVQILWDQRLPIYLMDMIIYNIDHHYSAFEYINTFNLIHSHKLSNTLENGICNSCVYECKLNWIEFECWLNWKWGGLIKYGEIIELTFSVMFNSWECNTMKLVSFSTWNSIVTWPAFEF